MYSFLKEKGTPPDVSVKECQQNLCSNRLEDFHSHDFVNKSKDVRL